MSALRFTFVLVRPKSPGNMGAAARALVAACTGSYWPAVEVAPL
ncbi:MAG: hypothetical protein ACREQC_01465 [Candidatus Binataceae bacterium]